MSHSSDYSRIQQIYSEVFATCNGYYLIEFNEFGEAFSIELGAGVASVIGQDEAVLTQQLGWSNFLAVEHQDTFAHHRRQLSLGQTGVSAYRVQQADGSSRWVVDSARPLWGEGEDFVGAIEGQLLDLGTTPGIAQYLKSFLVAK